MINLCNNLLINVIIKYPVFTHLIITKNNKCNNKIDIEKDNKSQPNRYKPIFLNRKKGISQKCRILLCYVMLLHLIINNNIIPFSHYYKGGSIYYV
jgi:hypothetical protein